MITINDVPLNIIGRACSLMTQYLWQAIDFWPEDNWDMLGTDWDLNVAHNDNIIFVTIYPVANGNTDTSQPVELLKRTVKPDEFRKEST
jgi:hypothetical protein